MRFYSGTNIFIRLALSLKQMGPDCQNVTVPNCLFVAYFFKRTTVNWDCFDHSSILSSEDRKLRLVPLHSCFLLQNDYQYSKYKQCNLE